MRDRVMLLIGLCGLVGFCFWSARKVGFLQHPVARTIVATPTPPHSVAPAPVVSSSTAPASPQPPSVPCAASKASDAADPTYMAFRVDKTQVFFPVSETNELCLRWDRIEKLVKLGTPIAENGPDGIWIADHAITEENNVLFERAHRGEVWQLEVSERSRVPAIIKDAAVAGVVGEVVGGFLAEVAPPSQPDFIASPNNYFAIHKAARGDPRPAGGAEASIGELPNWKGTPDLTAKIEQALQSQMKVEVSRRYKQSGSAHEQAVRDRYQQLLEGKGRLDYDTRAFRMTPDGTPRIFVRARWRIDSKPVFFMTAWLRTQPEPAVESADSSVTSLMEEFEGSVETVERLGTILNVFDYNNDGFGEFLFFQQGWEGFGIELFRYTDAGPVSTKTTFGGSA